MLKWHLPLESRSAGGQGGMGLAAQPHGARCPEVQTEPLLIPGAEPELQLSS